MLRLKNKTRAFVRFSYEDLRCLNGGPDGLRVITAVLKLSSNLLTAGKSCFLEIRHDRSRRA